MSRLRSRGGSRSVWPDRLIGGHPARLGTHVRALTRGGRRDAGAGPAGWKSTWAGVGGRHAHAVRSQQREGDRARRRLRAPATPRCGSTCAGGATPMGRSSRTATTASTGSTSSPGGRAGVVRRAGRDLRRQLPRADPVADRAAPPARARGDDRPRLPVGPVRRGPHRAARSDARPLVSDDRRPSHAVHRGGRLDGGLPSSSAHRSRRGRGLSLVGPAGGLPPPDARRVVGAGPLSAPHRRGRPAGCCTSRAGTTTRRSARPRTSRRWPPPAAPGNGC